MTSALIRYLSLKFLPHHLWREKRKKAKKLKTFVIGKARGGDFPFFFFFKSRKRMAKFSEGKWQIHSERSCLKIDPKGRERLFHALSLSLFRSGSLWVDAATPLIFANDFRATPADTSWWIGIKLIPICGGKMCFSLIVVVVEVFFFLHRKQTTFSGKQRRRRRGRKTNGGGRGAAANAADGVSPEMEESD